MEATGAEGTAWIMYWGVRVGSWSPFKIKNEQWGNGWLDGRSMFSPLRAEDAAAIRESLKTHPAREIPAEALSEFYRDVDRQIQDPAADPASFSR